MENKQLFDLTIISHLDLFNYKYPHEVIINLESYILKKIKTLSLDNYHLYEKDVYISKSAQVHPSAIIEGPCIIEDNVIVKPFSYIRSNVILDKNSQLGSYCEIKNSILLINAVTSHYNYVGDSILGNNTHLGAGVKLSNLKSSDHLIKVDTKKIGATLGDNTAIGCNTVLNPGVITGKNVIIYPVCSVRGIIDHNMIYKNNTEIVKKD